MKSNNFDLQHLVPTVVELDITTSKKLGFSINVNSHMTLTDIYNQEEKDFQQGKKRTQIGFRA